MPDSNNESSPDDRRAPQSGGVKRLTELVNQLEQQGADEKRLRAARCALTFKRSWIDLAAALSEVMRAGAFQAWGYQDLMTYAASELGLRSATTDKLLVSYATLQKHAPASLRGEGEGSIPSYQALDYLARATGEMRATGKAPRDAPDKPPDKKLMQELHSAVFDEGHSARQLRDRFDPVLRPRTPEQQQQIALRRLSAAAKRLLLQLDEVDELDELPVPNLESVLESLRKQAETLTEQLSELGTEECAA